MSGLPVVSLDEEIQFLKSVVIPSFAPRLKFGFDEEKRSEWMKLKAERYLTKEKADEFMDIFSTISTLEKAEEKLLLLEAKQERQQHSAAGGPVPPPPPPPQIEKLYEPSVAPSSVKSEDIKDNQLDDAYYSPCANIFSLIAHRLAYQILPNVQSDRLMDQIKMTLSDLKVAMVGSDPLGYCSQKHMKEEGITSLFAANISRCFSEFCRLKGLGKEMEDRVSIMHQSMLNTKAGKGGMDIGLFYRFLQTDKEFVHRGSTALFPLLFIEFTKTATMSIDKKLPQAALYANHLFRLMDFDKFLTWVPLLGIVMSENEMLFRLYSPSVVENKWKIAEVDVMRCAVSTKSIERLLHIMVEWTVQCTQFLCSPTAASPMKNDHLLLRKHCNVVMLGKKIFKSFDYREISQRSYVHATHRRDSVHYHKSDLAGMELVVDWTSDSNPQDSLQIISYDLVPGVHYPSIVGHLILVMRKMAQLHSEGIVHGDLRFSNIVFSDASDATVASTIIDFDHSGLADEKIYPPRFNPDITDGFRHAGARANEFLRPEHDIAALQWMCAQYRPKNVDLRETWSSCVSELVDGILGVADRLAAHQFEALEPVDKSMVVSVGIRGTGSPDTKRTHYT
eukprot:gene3747-4096_t